MILTIKTDNPQAEISLLDNDGQEVASESWLGHKELSVTILEKLTVLLEEAGQNWEDVSGIVIYEGPGSFTGLRIGVTVANTIAYAQKIPIVGATGDGWVNVGVAKLDNAEIGNFVMPVYGGEANITRPRK